MRSRSATPFFFAMALTLAGCKDDPDPITDPPDGSVTPDAGGCGVPAHIQWVSTTLEECGLVPDGDSGPSLHLCRWVLALNPDGSGTWSHSDVIETIGHECASSSATVTITRAGGGTVEATYDAASDRLTLDGIAYCRSGAAGCPGES